MNRFNTHYKKVVSYDLISKFNYKNSYQIPNINEISINLSSLKLTLDKRQIIPFLVAIELISGQKGTLTTSKKNRIHLKVKQGMVMGCKVTLNKKNSYNFLENLIIFVLPNLKEFKGFSINKKIPTIISFKIEDILNFFELNNEFLNFSQMPPINITIKLNSKEINESNILLNSFNFPLKK